MITSKTKKTSTAYTVHIKQIPMRYKTVRKKVNFMVDEAILMRIKEFVPEGERSNFVNGALEAAVKKYLQKEAMEFMENFSKENHMRLTNAEIRKLREYGRL